MVVKLWRRGVPYVRELREYVLSPLQQNGVRLEMCYWSCVWLAATIAFIMFTGRVAIMAVLPRPRGSFGSAPQRRVQGTPRPQ